MMQNNPKIQWKLNPKKNKTNQIKIKHEKPNNKINNRFSDNNEQKIQKSKSITNM